LVKPPAGTLAIMGSGELTSTMVQVHKDLLAGLGRNARAVFLDTPAGFELNADQISKRVVAYFRDKVLHPVDVVSIRSRESLSAFDLARALRSLQEADYILMGPGSPTYALRQWRDTPVPEIFEARIEEGGCLTAASAASLTIGRFTLPVYEIYKVGESPFWDEGIDLLGRFGFSLAVVPHWNNAEGGTFDTRFCFMGEPRFRRLEALLPEGVGILGVDEHTACILDFSRDEASVRGIGNVTLRRGGVERAFHKGERFPLGLLRGLSLGESDASSGPGDEDATPEEASPGASGAEGFWDRMHELERRFFQGLEARDSKEATNALLEIDRSVWEAQQDLEAPELISQARELFRELVVQFGMQLEPAGPDPRDVIAPLAEELLARREALRRTSRWEEADALREMLQRAGVMVEDTREGARWQWDPASPAGDSAEDASGGGGGSGREP